MHHSAGCRPKTTNTASPTTGKKKTKNLGKRAGLEGFEKLFQKLFAGRVCLWLIKRPKQTKQQQQPKSQRREKNRQKTKKKKQEDVEQKTIKTEHGMFVGVWVFDGGAIKSNRSSGFASSCRSSVPRSRIRHHNPSIYHINFFFQVTCVICDFCWKRENAATTVDRCPCAFRLFLGHFGRSS